MLHYSLILDNKLQLSFKIKINALTYFPWIWKWKRLLGDRRKEGVTHQVHVIFVHHH
jgi:hypothetical protein